MSARGDSAGSNDAPPGAGGAAGDLPRARAYLLSALALAAVLYPLRFDPQDPSTDGFPLSTYPMFSYDKPRTVHVTSALTLDEGGGETPVPPEFVATSETMQALRTISKSVRAGRKHARKLCEAIAVRVADSTDDAFARAEHVALVTVRVDSIDFLSGQRTPLERREHVRCTVRRRAR